MTPAASQYHLSCDHTSLWLLRHTTLASSGSIDTLWRHPIAFVRFSWPIGIRPMANDVLCGRVPERRSRVENKNMRVLIFGRVVTVGFVLAAFAIPSTARAQYPLDVLHEFGGYSSSFATGPHAPLIQGRDGNLYGTTRGGGTLNLGTVFRMTRGGAISVIHEFTGGPGGATPTSALLEATDGNFYGTANAATDTGARTAIFKLSPAGEFSVICVVRDTLSSNFSALVQGTDGNFYGTVSLGGAFGGGYVFRVTPAGAFTVLHEFPFSFDTIVDASMPVGLIQGADGNFYGTTSAGGVAGCPSAPYCSSFGNGTVFRMSPAGTVTVLHKFDGGSEGAEPRSGLIQATDGNFYGTTSAGGARAGTVFRITPAGNLTALYAFPPNGNGIAVYPGSLVRGADGNIYGTTANGGPASTGTIFRLTLQGNVTVLHRFETAWDGSYPLGLVQASDGRLYGTTSGGGIASRGTTFVMDVAGTTTTLHRFTGSSEGAYPQASLVQAGDGNFYGTTS